MTQKYSSRVLALGGLLALIAALVVLAFAFRPSLVPRAAGSPTPGTAPIQTGFLFLDGKYTPPPYDINVVNGDILINNQIVRPLPTPPASAPATKTPPNPPQTAGDLAEVAIARLHQLGVKTYGDVTPSIRGDVIGLLKSYPITASVDDQGASLVVTDKTGNAEQVALDFYQAPTLDELQADQVVRANVWRGLLQSGGTLVTAPNATMEVPPGRVRQFLGTLINVSTAAPSLKESALEQLTGSPPISTVLLASGNLPPDVVARVQDPTATPPALPSGRIGATPVPSLGHLGGALFSPMGDNPPLKDARTPGSDTAYIFLTLSMPRESAAIRQAALLQSYSVVTYEANWNDAGQSTISNLLGASGKAAILYVGAHGTLKNLCIEEWGNKADRNKAAAAYKARGIAVNDSLEADSHYYFGTDYLICIRTPTLNSLWKDRGTIVELASCESWSLAGGFSAREFIGSDAGTPNFAGTWYNGDFWHRLNGTKDNGTMRQVGDAFAATFAGTQFRLGGYGGGHTVLSPAVSQHSPTADAYVGDTVYGIVVFDTLMNTQENPLGAIQFYGCGMKQAFASARWQGAQILSFSFVPKEPGSLTIDVAGSHARSADNGVGLDGNQVPSGTDHVGPNTGGGTVGYSSSPGEVHPGTSSSLDGAIDNYTWVVQCLPRPANLPTQTPTPTLTRTATPTQTDTATTTSTPTITRTASVTRTTTVTRTPTTTSTATITPSPTPTPPCTSPQGTGPGPVVCKFTAVFVQAVFSTYYTVTAFDPAGGPLTYAWTNTNRCGDFLSGNSAQARWVHPDIPGGCPAQAVHPGIIVVYITSPSGAVRCIYPNGSAPGDVVQCVR